MYRCSRPKGSEPLFESRFGAPLAISAIYDDEIKCAQAAYDVCNDWDMVYLKGFVLAGSRDNVEGN